MLSTTLTCFPANAAPSSDKEEETRACNHQENVQQALEMVFMQDGAPAHTAQLTQQRCIEHLPGFLHKEEWPPNSPDLNPIENCWGILNSQALSSRPLTAMTQLNARATKEWGKIDPSLLKNLVHSIPKQLEAVIRMKGGHTGF